MKTKMVDASFNCIGPCFGVILEFPNVSRTVKARAALCQQNQHVSILNSTICRLKLTEENCRHHYKAGSYQY